MRSVLRLSGSGTFQILIGTASYVGLVRIMSVFGSDALAGYTIGIRVIIFALLPAFGHQQRGRDDGGAEPGRGAPRSRRARGVDGGALQHDLPRQRRPRLLSGGAADRGALHRPIPRCCRSRSSCLRIVSLGFLFYAVGMVLTQSFNGAGDTWTPTLINLGVFWLWEIPLAWWLAVHARLWPERRVHRDDGRVLDARGRQRGAVPPRRVEKEERLIRHWPRHIVAAIAGDS